MEAPTSNLTAKLFLNAAIIALLYLPPKHLSSLLYLKKKNDLRIVADQNVFRTFKTVASTNLSVSL